MSTGAPNSSALDCVPWAFAGASQQRQTTSNEETPMPCKSPMLLRRGRIGLRVSDLKASFLAEPARDSCAGVLHHRAAGYRVYLHEPLSYPAETRQKFARAGGNFREKIHGKDCETLHPGSGMSPCPPHSTWMGTLGLLLGMMYHTPVEGRNTAMSVFPSPS